MHEITIELIPNDRHLHEAEHAFSQDSAIQRESIEYLNYLDDGTGILLYRLRGAEKRIIQLLEETDDVISFQTIRVADGVRTHVHFSVDGTSERLIQLINQHKVAIEFPIECHDRGIRISAIGEQSDIADAVERFPEGLLVEVVSMTPTDASTRHQPLLSERQREVLEIAISEGYYEHPRSVTRDEIANCMGLTGSTVSEHLRKAESKILSDFVG
ncbi:MAG: VCBS repeat-containing protein [Natronomonas sp.]|jgi:VCBS repeat-containing protein|uniref:helix-turn-helix domain-containing protein n=1 Tax=Natronomonas sp. TaxID=2184060 RepID=UPI0039898EA2